MGRWIGWIVLLAGSEALGIAFGEWFFRLYIRSVPPAAMTTVHQATDHAVFLAYGAGAGAAIFLWTLLVASIAGMIAARRATSHAPAPPAGGAAPRAQEGIR